MLVVYFPSFFFVDSIDDDNNSIGRCRLFEWKWNVQHKHVFIMNRQCKRHTATVCIEATVPRPLVYTPPNLRKVYCTIYVRDISIYGYI